MKRKLLSIAMLLLTSAIQAQVGIGTTIPNKSAELTLLSKDKGLLIPNIPLESTTDQVTIVNGNVESLLVYATLKQGDIEPGFYYWDKTKWMRIVGDSDVVKIVMSNFHEIIKNEYVQNEIKQFFEIKGGNVYYDGTKFEYVDEHGDRHEINMQELVKVYETLTVLGYDTTTGVLTYQDERGNIVTVDIKEAVKSFETVTSVTSDATAGTITFKDEKGISTVLDIKQLFELNETLTVLGYDATTGVLTYKDENGDTVTVDIKGAVQSHETLTVLAYNSTTGVLTYQDENSNTTTVDLKTAIRANETVTKLVDNQDGTLTYYNENEIDETGLPIANTGTTFKIPIAESYELTSAITGKNAENTASLWTLRQFKAIPIYSGAGGIFIYDTGLTPMKIFKNTFDLNVESDAAKFMNFDFFVECEVLTMDDKIPEKTIFSMLKVEVYINNTLIKEFFPLRFEFGIPEGYEKKDVKHYGGILTYEDELPLYSTGNILEIRVSPTRNNFSTLSNTDGQAGYFDAFLMDANVMEVKISQPVFHVFEKM